MAVKEEIQKNFEKCVEPRDYAQKYKYFKVKQRITEKEDILSALKYIEELDPLGALLIASSKEKELAGEYAEDFVRRNRELLAENIKIDNDRIVYFMQMVYICAMFLSVENRDILFTDIFEENVYIRKEPKDYSFKSEKYVTEHYANVFLSAITKLPSDTGWISKYCEIATAIYKARHDDIYFLHRIEVGLRKTALGYSINENDARDYFNLLCDHGEYEAARFFLDNFDGSRGFLGMDFEEIRKILFAYPDPGLITLGKWCSSKINEDYTYDDWYREVMEYNEDPDCRKWIELTRYYHSIMEQVEEENWDEVEILLKLTDKYEMFDMGRIIYYKQMIDMFASMVNKMILDKTELVLPFIKALDDVNINSFSRMQGTPVNVWNQKNSVQAEFDYRKIVDVLFESYPIEDAVYIFMNSHLKHTVNIEDFVKECSLRVGENLYELFKDYPLTGSVSHGSRFSSVTDKLYISAKCVATGVQFFDYLKVCESYGENSPQAHEFNRKMIRSNQGWYSRNKETAELLHDGDKCTFYIESYQKNRGIYATDLTIPDDIRKQRIEERENHYPVVLKNWIRDIGEQGRFIVWNKEEAVYGVRLLSIDTRIDVAIEVLETIKKLMNNKAELNKFLNALTRAPLEEANEFRYISTQKSLEFFLPRERFNDVRRKIIDAGNLILKNEDLSPNLRRDIYLNTALRKFYDLQEVCKQISEEFYLETSDEPFVIAMKFEEEKDGSLYFSTKGRNNTIFSERRFVYRGTVENKLTPNWIYLVSLRNYDFEEGCFILEEVNLSNNQTDLWQKYIRHMFDLKKANRDGVPAIKERLKKYRIRITSKLHIAQFAYELNKVFENKRFDIEWALLVLEVFDATNPFIDDKLDLSELVERFTHDYSDSYSRFLDNYRTENRSAMRFCDLFFKSYLKVFIPFERFLDDIASEGAKDDIVNYCKYKEYI